MTQRSSSVARPRARGDDRRSLLRRRRPPLARGVLASLLLAGAAPCSVGTPAPGPACDPLDPSKLIAVELTPDGRHLSLNVHSASLVEVLERIAATLDVELIVADPSPDHSVTEHFDGLPIGAALRRLLGDRGYLLLLGPIGKSAAHSGGRLWIHAPGSAAAPAAAEAPAAKPADVPDGDEPPADATALVAQLADGNPRTRRTAVFDLGELAEPTTAALLAAALGDTDPRVREAAVEELAELGTESARIAIEGALHDRDAAVRLEAVDALADLGDASSARALERMLTDPDARVREAAADYLAERAR